MKKEYFHWTGYQQGLGLLVGLGFRMKLEFHLLNNIWKGGVLRDEKGFLMRKEALQSPDRLQSLRVRLQRCWSLKRLLLSGFKELLRGMESMKSERTSPDLASHLTPSQEQQSLLLFNELKDIIELDLFTGNSCLNSRRASLWS